MAADARPPVLVGVDGSAPSEAALHWAAHEACLRGVGLRVVHAFAGPPTDLHHGLTWEEAHQLVEESCLTAEKVAPGLHVRGRVVTQSAAVALVRLSARAGLVVLGKHGRGGFRHLFAGSVALHVAAHADVPVVLIHLGWRPPIDDREIVVDAGGEAALECAFAEAELRGVHLRAIRAWQPVMPAGPTGLTPTGMTMDELRENEEHVLARAIDPWRAQYPDVRVVESVVCDSTRHALIRASRAAELLVIGAHEHFGTHTLAPGTTAHAVIVHVTCPTLVAREPRRSHMAE